MLAAELCSVVTAVAGAILVCASVIPIRKAEDDIPAFVRLIFMFFGALLVNSAAVNVGLVLFEFAG